MSRHVYLVVDEREHQAFKASATAAGVSLSAWLRQAARERLARTQPTAMISVDDLDRFFAGCRERESGVEPHWDQHLAVMDQSRHEGT